jgi:hypothetical protein
LVDSADVYLLGTGLPSFWSVRMGEMRLMLGLSGWTANDWTGGSALEQLAPPAEPTAELMGSLAATFRERPSQTFDQIRRQTGGSVPDVLAGLNRLALFGQIIHDLHLGLYRWRQVMPVPLSVTDAEAESPETTAAKKFVANQEVRLSRDEPRPDGMRILEGLVISRPVSLLLDPDGRMLRGKCTCSHHFRGGLRAGPCRHLQALRSAVASSAAPLTMEAWLRSLGS